VISMKKSRATVRLLPAFVALAVVTPSLAGCGSSDGAAADGTVTLSFLSYNYGTADLGGEGTQELIDAFEKANPTIKIKPQGVAVADVLTKPRTSALAVNGFDVAQIGWSKMAQAYQTLPITPVQKIATARDWEDTSAGFNQAVLKATRHDGMTAAMPYTMSIPTLFYNADLFRTAGLDPAKPPTTMDQVKSAALRIVQHGARGVYFDAANASKSDFRCCGHCRARSNPPATSMAPTHFRCPAPSRTTRSPAGSSRCSGCCSTLWSPPRR
jgi:multiple sugar transport system substrate-binding protein